MTQSANLKKLRIKLIFLIVTFVFVMILTVYKDLWLTGHKPNILFYLTVPLVSIFGSTLAGYGMIKVQKVPISFLNILYIVFICNVWGQVFENVSKLIYYQLWSYPGWLYLIFLFAIVFVVPIYILICLHKLQWHHATLIAVAICMGGILFSIGLTSMTGIETYGS